MCHTKSHEQALSLPIPCLVPPMTCFSMVVAPLKAPCYHHRSMLSSPLSGICEPNASAHLLPEAGAQRTLEAVRCSAWFGAVGWPRELLRPACPDQHFDVHHQAPVGLECRQPCLHLLPYCPAT